MRILLINSNQEKLPQPIVPIGVCCIATALAQHDHAVRVTDLCFARDPQNTLAQAIREHAPDVIGLSIRNIDNSDAQSPRFYLPAIKQLVETIKTLTNVPIVIGGSAVSVAPQQILDYLDCSLAVVGEGEEGIVRLLEELERGGLEAYSRVSPKAVPPTRDILGHGANQPDRSKSDQTIQRIIRGEPGACGGAELLAPQVHRWIDLRPYRRYRVPIPIQTKRGCALHCAYCTYQNLEGAGYRLKPPEQVAAEIAETVCDSGYGFFEFVDSTFNQPHDHALAVCEAIIDRGQTLRSKVKLQASINPMGLSMELLKAMKWAGFDSVVCTPDSASDSVLAGLEKGFTQSELQSAVQKLHALDLPVMWCFLFGGPGETEATARETLDFIEQQLNNRDVVFLSSGIRIYPGTTLEKIARAEGVIEQADTLLEPSFFFSPELPREIFDALLAEHLARHKSYLRAADLQLGFLLAFQRISGWLGLKTPLWRYAGWFNRCLPQRSVISTPTQHTQPDDKGV